jgi:ketosteroid isomerase-like protein
MNMNADTIRDIEARDAVRAKATIAGDLETLADCFADTLRYTHSSASVDTKASYLEKLRSGFYVYQGFTNLKRECEVHGDTALVYGDVQIDVTVKGTVKKITSRYLAVWMRQGGVWRMAAWQSTPIPA